MADHTQSRNTYYRLLHRRMIATIIVVSFTPLILVISILLHQFTISYQHKTYAHLEELVQKHKQNIDTFLNEKLSNLISLTSHYTYAELSDKNFLEQELQRLRTAYGDVLVDLGCIDHKGNQLAYAGHYNLENAFYAEADWFQAAINKRFFISDVFMGLRGSPHFIITVGNLHQDEPWLLRATIDFNAFNTLVKNLRIGQTGFAFIVNSSGQFQTRPPFDYEICQSCYQYFTEAVNGSGGAVHIVERNDETGEKHLYAVAELKGGDWMLIFKQETSDAFSELTRMYGLAIAIFFLGALAIIAMTTVLSRRMIRRIRITDEEKEELNQQMIETGKLASVGELAAGIAHEINNPVAIMVEEAGWIGDLLEDVDPDRADTPPPDLPEIERALQQIRTQGQRCKEITHKLLSFARKTDSTTRDVQMNDLIREIITLSEQMARYNKVTITTDLMTDLPYVTISPSEMQQVILNLINNALDVMEKTGGAIHITTKMSRLEKDHIVITVEDNGPGIPEANLPLIFDPFFTTKPVGKGTGLGLSICYGIVQKMGGKIDVHSAIGQGTRFRIWIPYQKDGAPAGPDKSSLPENSQDTNPSVNMDDNKK